MGAPRRPTLNGIEVAMDMEQFTTAELLRVAGEPADRLLIRLDGEANTLVGKDEILSATDSDFGVIPRYKVAR